MDKPLHFTLTTSRLILRPLRLSDASRIQELFPHWEIVQYLATVIPWPYPDDGARQFLSRILTDMEQGDRYGWAITLKEDGDDQLIGVIDLFPNNPDDNRGFWIGVPYQRQGYMIEAVTAVNDFAFDTLALPRLILNNAEPNIASHRLKEKSGAAITDIADDVPFVGGAFRKIRWTLTREQWHANRQRFLTR